MSELEEQEMRILQAWMNSDGMTQEQIAQVSGVSIVDVRRIFMHTWSDKYTLKTYDVGDSRFLVPDNRLIAIRWNQLTAIQATEKFDLEAKELQKQAHDTAIKTAPKQLTISKIGVAGTLISAIAAIISITISTCNKKEISDIQEQFQSMQTKQQLTDSLLRSLVNEKMNHPYFSQEDTSKMNDTGK